MALSTRELLLILRARDEMSGVVASSGASLNALSKETQNASNKALGMGLAFAGTGQILANAGKAILGFGADSVFATVDANKSAALIATQAQNLGLSVQEVNDMINRVGDIRGTSLEGLRESLFEILSTVEVSGPQAEQILRDLATAGVASGGSSADFAEVTTAAMNAFGKEAKDALPILDAMFRAVEQGQGTYANFASGFSTAIPSAQAFNQTMEDTFAAVAFVTKATGLSEQEAGTAVARTFDLFKKSDVRAALDDIGVATVDAKGNFRSILPILKDMEVAFKGLNAEERESALEEIFGPNVRAFRFLNPAIGDMELLESVIQEVNSGVAEGSGIWGAYAIQNELTHTRIQELKNDFEILKQTVGHALIPVLEQLLDWGTRLIDVWRGLSPETQKTIVQFLAIAGAVAVFVGTIFTVIGAILTAKAVFAILGISLKTVALASGSVLGIFALLALAAFLIYKNWDTVGPIFFKFVGILKQVGGVILDFFNVIKGGVRAFIESWKHFEDGTTSSGFALFMEKLGINLRRAWEVIKFIFNEISGGIKAFIGTWKNFEDGTTSSGFPLLMEKLAIFIRGTLIPAIVEFATIAFTAFMTAKDAIVTAVTTVIDSLVSFWNFLSATFGPGLSDIWNTLKEEFAALAAEFSEFGAMLGEVFNDILTVASVAWEGIKIATDVAWNGFIIPIVTAAINFIKELFHIFAPTVVAIVSVAWDLIKSVFINTAQFLGDYIGAWLLFLWRTFKTIWDLIVAVIQFAIILISNIIQIVLNIIEGDWSGVWQNVKNIFKATWDLIIAIGRAAVEIIWNLLRLFGTVVWSILRNLSTIALSIITGMWELAKGAFTSGIRAVEALVRRLPGTIKSIFSNVGNLLWDAGRKIINGLIEGVSSKITSLKNKFSSITKLIPDWKGPADVDRKLLVKNGEMIMEGLGIGLNSGFDDVKKQLNGYTNASNFDPNLNLTASSNGNNGNIEMLIASLISAIQSNADAGDRVGLKVEGDLVLGSSDDIAELDWWARTKVAGV